MFTGPQYIFPAKSYPKDTLHVSYGKALETVTFKMIAMGKPGNTLCEEVRSNPRYRRSLDNGLLCSFKNADIQNLRSCLNFKSIFI